MNHRPRITCASAAIAIILLAGCSERSPSPSADAPALSTEAGDTRAAVTVALRDDAITTAQRTELTITKSTSKGVEIASPTIEDLLAPWRVSRTDAPVRTSGVDRVTTTTIYRLDPFLPGEYEIPTLEFAWTDSNTDETGTFTTEPLLAHVTSVLDENSGNELADIKPLATPAPEPNWPVLIIVAGSTAALLAIATFVLARRAKRAAIRAVDRVPAHEVALSQLGVLDPTDATGEQRAKRFYADTSGVVRTYIEDRFGIHAPDRTTEEFLRECAISFDLASDDVRTLERFLSQCDLVKFAKHTPGVQEATNAIDAARGFIEKTADESRVVVFDLHTGERLGTESLDDAHDGEVRT